MKKKVLFYFIGIFLSVSIAVAIGEIGVRLVGQQDSAGNFYFLGRHIKPYILPPGRGDLDEKIQNYLSRLSEGGVYMRYDPFLGWVGAPNAIQSSTVSEGELLHRTNSVGMRSAPTEYPLSPQEGVLRIALFGDSFTAGLDVPFESTWGYHLENRLNDSDIYTEVLNFGVGAYGIDQAYLRWKEQGARYSPHIVVLGLQMENTKRNVNIFRPFYNRFTGVIFTKPRFVLESGKLKLINVRTIEPERVPDVVKNFGEWEHAENEYFYEPKDYEHHIWLKSKLVATTLELFSRRLRKMRESEEYYFPDGGPGKLAYRIIDEFKRDVEATGAQFLIVHLPEKKDLETVGNGNEFVYAELLDRIKETEVVIDPTQAMLDEAEESLLDALFITTHYSIEGNRVVGDVVADFLVQRQNELSGQ